MKKKIAAVLTAAVLGATAFAGTVSAASGDITVVSREDGSGTRGAFHRTVRNRRKTAVMRR